MLLTEGMHQEDLRQVLLYLKQLLRNMMPMAVISIRQFQKIVNSSNRLCALFLCFVMEPTKK
jgi:hypothetical protein